MDNEDLNLDNTDLDNADLDSTDLDDAGLDSTDPVADSEGVDLEDGFGSPVADEVYRLLAPVVATVGAEIVDVRWAGGTLRVVPDREGGINTDGLAEINRLVSPILDQHDPVPGRYTLEVSSPGVERPLRRADHYRRAVGEIVIVKQIPGLEPRRLKGVLESFDAGRLTMKVTEADGIDLAEEETRTVELADVDSAKTHFEWGPTPKKPGGGQRKKSSGKSQKKKSNTGKSSTTKEEQVGHE